MTIYPNIAGRDWQQNGLKVWNEKLKSDDQDMFIYACPGAGKTRFSLAAIKHALDLEAFDLVIVVAPTETLRGQWRDEALVLTGISFHHYSSDQLRQAMIDSDPHAVGIVTTYQQMALVPEVFEAFCSNMRVLVVFDEIHHCCDKATWGTAAEISFNGATKRLILSGTPFRSDGQRIPFIMEPIGDGEWGVREPDAKYSYRNAVDEKVCRVITFQRMNASITFEDDGGTWTGVLDDEGVAPAFRSKLYRAALDANACGFPRVMLETAWHRLQEIRLTEQEDAAMLVIARDQNQARLLQDIMHAITAKKVPVVMSEEHRSKDIIERFKKSKQPAIVSVKMFAEGVDAPRIRVIVFMSREKTEMWFRQIVGRAVRYQDEPHISGPQWSHMFIPKLPELEEMARAIENDISHIVKDGKPVTPGPTPPSPPEGPGGPSPTPPHFVVHGSEEERREGFISMGEDVTEDEARIGNELVSSNPILRRVGAEIVTMIATIVAKSPGLAERFKDMGVHLDD